MDMMMAVTTGKTHPTYGRFNRWLDYDIVVNKSHIYECNLLRGVGKITKYNAQLVHVKLANLTRICQSRQSCT
jgi:hypothetical protein